jgi:hypothetical protein
MSEDQSVFEYISTVTEINDMSSIMQDKKLDEALELIIKLTVKPDVPAAVIGRTVVQARALAAELKLKAKYYMIWEKDERDKKNLYFTVAEELSGLADALKYLARGV